MKETVRSAFDAAAPSFEEHRDFPAGVPEAIRSAVWVAAGAPARGRVLDLGAGTGRVGRAFVAAGDRYVGVDASLGMLQAFADLQRRSGVVSIGLAQAIGEALPFGDGVFDAVLLMQAVSEGGGWRRLLADAPRVLKTDGRLMVGRTIKPEDGVDGQLKDRFKVVLAQMGVDMDGPRPHRTDAMSWLEARAAGRTRVEATTWTSSRTPRRFLDRHQTGHRFSQLPAATREAATAEVSNWAVATFGSLDTVSPETYRFELQVFTFSKG